MTVRALLAWLAILVLAIVNGALRQALLIPRMGERAGHVVSTLLLSLLVFGAAWILVPWIRPGTTRDAWVIGVVWVILTLSFEFLAGHYLFGNTWEKLLEDYNVAAGRIWVLVVITTLLAPVLVFGMRAQQP
jgi:hypothetical protein